MEKGIGNNRGSLSLEAAITFPIFIVFFALLIFCIKIASVNIVLNHAVNETAKQLATTSYPVAMINELEDDTFSEGLEGGIPTFSEESENIRSYLFEGSEDIFRKLLSGDLEQDDIEDNLKNIKDSVVSDYISGFAKHIVNSSGENYFDIKNSAAYLLTENVLGKFLEGSGANKEDIELLLVKLPQSDIEYQLGNEEIDGVRSDLYGGIGLIPEKDDVVVAVQYKTKIPFPFLGDRELVYIFTAVEKAWTHGGNGVYTIHPEMADSEGSAGTDRNTGRETSVEENYKKLQERTVFVTRTGKKYHEDGCRYLAKSKIPVKIGEAEERGYTPCKKCHGK